MPVIENRTASVMTFPAGGVVVPAFGSTPNVSQSVLDHPDNRAWMQSHLRRNELGILPDAAPKKPKKGAIPTRADIATADREALAAMAKAAGLMMPEDTTDDALREMIAESLHG